MLYNSVQEKFVPRLKLWIRSDGLVTYDQKYYFKGHKFNGGRKKPKYYYRLNTEGIKDILVHRLVAQTFCENHRYNEAMGEPCRVHLTAQGHPFSCLGSLAVLELLFALQVPESCLKS